MLAPLALFLTVSCSHLTPTEQQLIDCGSASVQQTLTKPGPDGTPSLITQVGSLLNSGQVNWQEGLDSLLATAGNTVICGVHAVIGDLEHASRAPRDEVALIHGQAWLAADSKYKLVKNPPPNTSAYRPK